MKAYPVDPEDENLLRSCYRNEDDGDLQALALMPGAAGVQWMADLNLALFNLALVENERAALDQAARTFVAAGCARGTFVALSSRDDLEVLATWSSDADGIEVRFSGLEVLSSAAAIKMVKAAGPELARAGVHSICGVASACVAATSGTFAVVASADAALRANSALGEVLGVFLAQLGARLTQAKSATTLA